MAAASRDRWAGPARQRSARAAGAGGWLAALALLLGLLSLPAQATITVAGTAYGRNEGLPTNGTPGALTIPKPAAVTPGMALVASIAARPRSMTVVVPAGWQLMTFTDEPDGGQATAPYGMSMVTYYKIATTNEPSTYTWTFANPSNSGGAAVGALLAINGIDTASGNPIDNNGNAWSAYINGNGLTFRTGTITTVTPYTTVLSSLTYLSSGSFSAPSGISGITEAIDVSGPAAAGPIGITIQMSTATVPGTGTVGPVTSNASNDDDYGIGHLMAMQPSGIDPSMTMSRSNALSPGGGASYTMTVKNIGLQAEPGPLTIVNTLPSGLSYSSASGSGWSCGSSGQTVTCTRSGALAAQATAPLLAVNVTVDAGVSGPLTYSATVSGTGGDANVYNNVAVDTYVVPTAAYAYYAFDEAAWGTIADATGNGHNASALGSAGPTGSNVPSPPGAALTGSPGTCGAASIPASTSATGVNTGIDINSLGNAGTIAFWYAGNNNWSDGNPHLLLDASADLGSSDRHFFLAKDGAGALVFSVSDSAGNSATVSSPQYGYKADEWHHIAVTWTAGGALAIYLDGALAASSSSGGLNGTMGAVTTLYLGGQRMAGVTGTPAAYTANSADGLMDELRIYTSVLTVQEIEAMTHWTHTCTTGIDHYELSLPSSAVSCLASTVTVTACTTSTTPCTSKATTLNGQTATLGASAGALAATTVTFDATGVASTTLSYAGVSNASTVTVSLSGEQALAHAARQCCPNGSSCSAASSCAVSVNTAGFIIASAANGSAATLPSTTAGSTSATYTLRAIKTSTTTKACEAALSGSTTVNWGYQCNNPTSCSSGNRLTLTGSSATAVAGNANGSSASSTAVAMTFDANGNAPFSFNYADVGQITLLASKAAGGSLASALSGNSNAFVAKPAGFALSAIKCSSYAAGACATSAIASPGNNPGASNGSGTAFLPAGSPFSVTVTALDSGGNTTPNYGRETTPEGVTLGLALVSPAGGSSGVLANASGFGSFSNGVATGTGFSWSEVGVVTLTPSVADADYLGAGNVSGTASGNVGRFTPHHFDVAVTPACSASFSYAGQPFAVSATARNGLASPGTTSNYSNALGYAKALALSDAGALGLGSLSGSLAASAFASGAGSGSASYSFNAKQTAPQTLALRATDSDGISSQGYTEGSTALRSGRLRLSNATGKASASLQVAVRTEYWGGNAWVLNSADGCTALAANAVVVSNPRDATGAASTATTSASAVALAGGQGVLTLAAPSPASRSLSVDLAFNLGASSADQSCNSLHPASTGAALAWLRSQNGSCAASADRDPAAHASFGVYSAETRKTVHVRDVY